MLDPIYNIGIPALVFYVVSISLLTLLYWKKLKFFFAFLYAISVASFNSSFWEFPFGLVSPYGWSMSSASVTGLVYFVPLALFVLFYNVKFLDRKKVLLICLSFLICCLYGILYPQVYLVPYGGEYGYFVFEYLTTFIPRTVSIIVLGYVCIPDVSKTRFRIKKGQATTNEK